MVAGLRMMWGGCSGAGDAERTRRAAGLGLRMRVRMQPAPISLLQGLQGCSVLLEGLDCGHGQ